MTQEHGKDGEEQEDEGYVRFSLSAYMACVWQISASGEKMYHDAYTLQKVEHEHLSSFNFAAGMVPFLLNLIQDVRIYITIL